MSVNFKFPYNGQTVDVEDYYVKIDPFTQGTLWSCGSNNNGQLGDNTTSDKSSPVQATTFGSTWVTAAAGLNFSAAIKTDGTLWLWGANSKGQLGDNTTVDKSSPVQAVTTGANWLTVSCGYANAFGIKTLGTLWGWGLNGQGQLGDNTTVNKSSPVQTVTFAKNWQQVSAGYSFTAAIKTDGTVWCWGQNLGGQVGDNTTVNKSSPVQTVTTGNTWKSVAAGTNFSFMIKDANF